MPFLGWRAGAAGTAAATDTVLPPAIKYSKIRTCTPTSTTTPFHKTVLRTPPEPTRKKGANSAHKISRGGASYAGTLQPSGSYSERLRRGVSFLEKTRFGVVNAAHRVVVECDATDTTVSGEDPGLRFDFLRRENPLYRCKNRVAVQ